MLPKLKVLFLCTKNSCRSQMAEGWARFLHAQTLEAHSAGIAPGALDPRAVDVMREVGIDISNQWSKGVEALRELDFDWVVTVCDAASEACPAFPRAVRKLHVSFEDPQRPAALSAAGDPLPHYRRVRDQIGAFVRELPARLERDVPEPAQPDDLYAVIGLVRASGLPAAGIEGAFPAGYAVVRREGEIVGVAGLERHGSTGLLRSVAVKPDLRGAGLGQRLVADRLELARRQKLAAVYLLTTTAAPFFRRLGFADTPRAAAPATLQQSSEFSSICPSTAVCLVRSLT